MPVAELQALTDQLSADIDLQKEVLKQLGEKKSAAQRRLNAVRDPFAQLALELSSKIFLECLPPYHPYPYADDAPMLLLNVCNAWTDIALSSPALWAAIHMESPGVELLEVWLQRARHCNLSVTLHNALCKDVAVVLGQHGKQLNHL
ncbi:hypothetical protein B0H14DRAFT_3159926 [Mycena olivaceomarginata]|nr:hypothetical protein B0H14DRAFT_3159926 [Mycena olivaceomarginata]